MRRINLFLVLFAVVSWAACAVNPATGQRQFSLIGTGQEIELGREYDQQMVAELGLYPDSAWQVYVQELGERMARLSERPELPWTFRVVDDPIVNAFAVPGGYIYITRGILAHFNSEAELAAVLGHEIGHITARHSATQMSRAMLAQLGVGAVQVLAPDAAGAAELASAGLGLLFLKYGRDDERQADDLGLRYMRAAGYDVSQMAGVFEMLGRVSGGEGAGGVPSWLSTHPAPEDRRERTEAQVAADPSPPNAIVGRESFLRRLDGLVYGEDPRQGFFEGERFLHPTLEFQLDFPSGWRSANQRQAVLAMSPEQDALIQLTIAADPGADAETAAAAQVASPAAGRTAAMTAARNFIAESGFSTTAPAAAAVNGLPASVLDFVATTESGEVRGRATFIAHGGRVFQLLAYGPSGAWAERRAVAETAVASFRPLTDPAVLGLQPRRIRIIELDAPTTLAEIARTRRGVRATVEELALLNGVEEGARLGVGTVVKVVE